MLLYFFDFYEKAFKQTKIWAVLEGTNITLLLLCENKTVQFSNFKHVFIVKFKNV